MELWKNNCWYFNMIILKKICKIYFIRKINDFVYYVYIYDVLKYIYIYI